MNPPTFLWLKIEGVCATRHVKEFALIDLDKPLILKELSHDSPWQILEDAIKRLVARERGIPFTNMLKVEPIVWSSDIDLMNPGYITSDFEADLRNVLYTKYVG